MKLRVALLLLLAVIAAAGVFIALDARSDGAEEFAAAGAVRAAEAPREAAGDADSKPSAPAAQTGSAASRRSLDDGDVWSSVVWTPPSAAELQQTEIVVRGRVVDTHHTPIAGAEIRAQKIFFDGEAQRVAQRTDAAGRFEAALPWIAPWHLEVRSAGCAPRIISSIGGVAAVDLGDVVMSAGCRLRVRAVTSSGAPAAHAAVAAVYGAGFTPKTRGSRNLPVAWTDASGWAVLENLPFNYIILDLKAANSAAASLAISPNPTEIELVREVTLPDSIQITGDVVDEAARPVENVSVNYSYGDHDFEVTTDACGKFAIVDFPKEHGAVLVYASCEGYQPTRLIPGDVGTPLRAVLRRTSEAHWIDVRDAEERPAPEIRSILFEDVHGDVPRLAALREGERTVLSPSRWRVDRAMDAVRAVTVELTDGRAMTRNVAREKDLNTFIEFSFAEQKSLTGRVSLPTGAPAAGVLVEIYEGDGTWRPPMRTTTDKSGNYQFVGVRFNPTTITLRVRSNRYSCAPRDVRLFPSGETAAPELQLEEPARWDVRFTRDGAALGGAPVAYYFFADDRNAWMPYLVASTDADGTAHAATLFEGRWLAAPVMMRDAGPASWYTSAPAFSNSNDFARRWPVAADLAAGERRALAFDLKDLPTWK